MKKNKKIFVLDTSVLLHDFHNEVHANGKFDLPPESKASVSSFYGGAIKELKLLPGEYVKKGSLLFKLENPDFVQNSFEHFLCILKKNISLLMEKTIKLIPRKNY